MAHDLDFMADPLTTAKLNWINVDKKLKDNLSFLTVNVRSISKKFSEFLSYIESTKSKISFILVTETWLDRQTDLTFEIPGYKSYNYYRNDHSTVSRRGGGLKLYVLEHIETCVIDLPVCPSCESLLINDFVPGLGKLNIVCIYRPPYQLSDKIDEFLTHMDNLFDSHGRN